MPQVFDTGPESVTQDESEARAALVLSLRRRGLNDRRVHSAIERVPRRLFLSARHHRFAYEDSLLPIECGQVVSAPSMVARMVQLLEIAPNHRVLEIGTGSGYQTAILSHLSQYVFTADRYQTLINLARQRIAALKIQNVEFHHADGLTGLRERAPYDRIILTGSVPAIPDSVRLQLAPDGILLAPVGPAGQQQDLMCMRKVDGEYQSSKVGEVRLVALRDGIAQVL
ncbi:protein-L-isoaspartate(D-aspartate) O-methyltransferase [Pannonibacter phragmitetus]|uniref:protein-L-isoaspartate(D-aspartate) O-methyltransferase n=1 Tax=Pannonibacter phragmitetus TaxID=121719 RepID=UPI000B9701B7|nr:protein-L-isoaspartate(D-aspartate) O-methyltransferase [Pannonibacter phragmitetus]